MSLNDKMNNLMNSVRGVTGLAQQLSIDDAANALNGSTNVLHKFKVDLTDDKYDSDTWYPVVCHAYAEGNIERILVKRGLDDKGGAPWGNHRISNGHGFACYKDVLLNHTSWDTFMIYAYLLANWHSFDDGKNPVHVDEIAHNGGYLLWLRGGAFYNVETDIENASWNIFEDGIKTNDYSFTPTKEEPEDFASVKSSQIRPNVPELNFIDFTTLGHRLAKLEG